MLRADLTRFVAATFRDRPSIQNLSTEAPLDSHLRPPCNGSSASPPGPLIPPDPCSLRSFAAQLRAAGGMPAGSNVHLAVHFRLALVPRPRTCTRVTISWPSSRSASSSPCENLFDRGSLLTVWPHRSTTSRLLSARCYARSAWRPRPPDPASLVERDLAEAFARVREALSPLSLSH